MMTLACLSLLLALLAQCTSGQVTLTSIQPPKLSVNLTYMINGEMVNPSPVCKDQAPGSACLPKPQAAKDRIMITYGVLPQFSANESNTVQLKACYSAFSRVNRPWRASNNIIAKSKACPFVIANGLNPTSGNRTWTPPNNVPIATYYIKAYVMAKGATQVAFGDSPGFFEVKPISTREKGLVAAAAICICVGPILFTGFMLWEFKIKKV